MNDQPSTTEVLREHRYEIDTLKEQSSETNRNINKLIDSMNGLSKNFAVYAEKHDRTRDDVTKLHDEIKSGFVSVRQDLEQTKKLVQAHEVIIAGHTPVIDSLRKLNNRLMIAAILFIASSSTVGYLAVQG
jgi:uncharacterized coiled-coil DUF342 family protein